MRINRSLSLAIILTAAATITQGATFWVTGNAQGNTSETFPTIRIPCAKYTHITHYAANPGPGGTIANGSLSPSENSALVAACHAVGTKVLYSIFDPGGGGAFITATNSTNLSTFVTNTVAYMNTYGYDGVDLDWEGTLVTSQYNAYITALRAAIGAGKLITMNAYPGGGATPLTTASTQYPNLDQINIMAYDADLFVTYTWHNAAIASTNGDTTHPTDAVELGQFLAAGIPRAKLGMGFPFYGRHYTGTDAPLQTGGTQSGPFIQYSALATNPALLNSTNYRWDSTFQADYLSLVSTNEFYTYNGVASVNAFVPWVKSQSLGGIMVYQLNYEFISSASGDARYPLSTPLNAAVLAAPTFSASPTSLTLASTAVGSSSGPQSTTITNTGTASMTISSITLTGANAGEFSKTTTCGSTLAASATCTVTVTFTPSSAGAKTAAISVADNASGSPHTVALSGTATLPTLCNNNSSTDPGVLQSAINAGGSLTVTGTCNLATNLISINNAIQISGGTFTATSSFTGNSFSVNVDNVGFTNSTFVNAGIFIPSQASNHGTQRNGFTMDGCTMRDFTAVDRQGAFLADAILRNGHILTSTFQNIWALGFPNATYVSFTNEGHMPTALYWKGGLDNFQIEFNTFNQIGYNGIKGFADGLSRISGGYMASGASMSYNTFKYIHRIGIEVQNADSTGGGSPYDGFAIAFNQLKVAGNFLSHPAFAILDTYAYSLPIVGNSNSQYINNTMVGNFTTGNTTAPQSRLGLGIEMPPGTNCCNGPIAGIGGGTNRGNVISGENNPAGGGTPGWFNAFTNYHGPNALPTAATTYTFDDNYMCGPNANLVISNAGDGKTVDTHNFKAACVATGTGLFTSAMAYTWTSANNQNFPSGGSGTWSLWVTDPVSVRWVDFYLDGSSTSANHQEIQDDSSTFGTDRRWLYHYTFNTSSLSSGTHTILAKLTDSTGTVLTTSAQTFTQGGPPGPVVCVNNSTDQPAVQNAINGSGTVSISGTCLISTLVSVNNAVTLTGTATFTGAGSFSVNADSFTSTNLIWNGIPITFTGAATTRRNNITLTGNTFQNYTGATGPLHFLSILTNSTITANHFNNVWPGGYPTNSNAGDIGVPDILGDSGIDSTLISGNTFDLMANDGIHWFMQGMMPSSGPLVTGHNVVFSDNTFTRVHRIAIELQGTSGTCNGGSCSFSSQTQVGLRVTGNITHNPVFPYANNGAYSLSSCQAGCGDVYANNTAIMEDTSPGVASATASANCINTVAGMKATISGNVCGSGSGAAKPWNPDIQNYACFPNNSDPSCVPADRQYTNNYFCGGPAGSHIATATTFVATSNLDTNVACLTTVQTAASSIVPAFASASQNQALPVGGIGTWNSTVISSMSIRNVQFFLDTSTLVATTSTQDSSSTFASDTKWLYHVTFNVTGLSVATHTMTATYTDVNGTQQSVTTNFTVGGGTPAIVLSPTSENFGTVSLGATSSPLVITLQSTGTAVLNISSITVMGTNFSDFDETNTCPASLAASSSCTISVTFSPSAIGARVASVSITDNASGSPHSVSLSGTGTSAIPVLSGCNLTLGTANVLEASTRQGTPCTIAISNQATVTLDGNGSITCAPNCSLATSVTFTPATSVSGGTAIRGGCPVVPVDTIYNAPINLLPLESRSGAWMTYLVSQSPSWNLLIRPSWALDITDNATPTVSYAPFFYTSSEDGVQWPNPYRPSIGREAGAEVFLATGVDHHWDRVNQQTCQFYETYQDGVSYAGLGCPSCKAGSGFNWNGNTYDLPTDPRGSTEAAGGIRTPETLTLQDIMGLTAPHLLRGEMATGYISNATFLWPATQPNGSICPLTNCPPYGAIFRLSTAWCAGHLSGYTGFQHNIVRFFCEGGIQLSDASVGGLTIATDYDVAGSPAARSAIDALNFTIPWTNLEVVDQSSLMVDPSSSRWNPVNAASVVPPNTSVITVDYGSGTAVVPIAVQPVGIGMTYPSFAKLAGSTAVQLAWWVNGTANQSVTWVKTSGTGTVTSGGLFTPPASLGVAETDILTGTSAADSNAQILVTISVLPADGAHAGSIAIDIAGPQCQTATCTRLFQADAAIPQWGATWFTDDDNVVWGGADATVWRWSEHNSSNGDGRWGPFNVPNGNYTVTVGSGQTSCPSTYMQTTFNNNLSLAGALMMEGNGQIGAVVDFGKVAGNSHLCRQTSTSAFPVKVTNGYLTVGVRSQDYLTNGGMTTPTINIIEIDPDATTQHWGVDGQAAGFVALSQVLQFRQVDYWTGKSCPNNDQAFSNDTCTWTVNGVVGGNSTVGTITSKGLYTAPATSHATKSITIGVSDGTFSASYGLFLKGDTNPLLLF